MFKHLKTHEHRGNSSWRMKAGFPLNHIISVWSQHHFRSELTVHSRWSSWENLSHEITVFNSLLHLSNILEKCHVQGYQRIFEKVLNFDIPRSSTFCQNKATYLSLVDLLHKCNHVRYKRGYKINTRHGHCPERAFGSPTGTCGI